MCIFSSWLWSLTTDIKSIRSFFAWRYTRTLDWVICQMHKIVQIFQIKIFTRKSNVAVVVDPNCRLPKRRNQKPLSNIKLASVNYQRSFNVPLQLIIDVDVEILIPESRQSSAYRDPLGVFLKWCKVWTHVSKYHFFAPLLWISSTCLKTASRSSWTLIPLPREEWQGFTVSSFFTCFPTKKSRKQS